MKPFRSIRWRLLAWYGVLLASILTGLGFTAFQYQSAREEQTIDLDLQERVGILARSLRPERGPTDNPPPPEEAGDPPRPAPRKKSLKLSPEDLPYFDQKTGFYYAVWLKNGPGLTVSPHAPGNIPKPDEEDTGARTRGSLREVYLSAGPGDCVLAGISIDAYHSGLARFGWFLAASGLGLLAISLLGGWWIITAALRPIQSITSTADRIANGDLTQRIDARDTESELGELAGLLNKTFSRLDAVFTQQARFTADAAHELRTPVTVILTHAQNGLALTENNEEQREAFGACQRAAQRMRGLIESLLQLTRFNAGKEPLKRIPCDLSHIAEEAVEMLRPLAESRNMAIRMDLAPAGIQGDPDQLDQVLCNLLTNAIHYGNESGEIRVVTRKKEGRAFCTVSDNGPGIAPGHLPHIFERFYRADKARTAAAGRTGLGLAISKAIVESHGGTIEAQSTFGKGSSFTVAFPAL